MENDKIVPWKNVIIYCILAFALFWIPYFGLTSAIRAENNTGVWTALLGIMGPFSPLIAAVAVRALAAREGFRDARLGFFRVRWYYWLFALLLPFFWNTVQDLLHLLFGNSSMDWEKASSGLYRIPINLFAGLFIFIGEEFGWRSYLLEKLRPLGRWRALLLSGLIWSLWHLPALSIVNPSSPYADQTSFAGILLTLLIFVLMGFIFGWLYLESKSVWPCVLMHSYNNLIGFKLLSESYTVVSEPSMLENALIAVGPILFIWLIIFFKGGYKQKAS